MVVNPSYNGLIREIEEEESKRRRAATWADVTGALSAPLSTHNATTTFNSGTVSGTYWSNPFGTYAIDPYTKTPTANYPRAYVGISPTITYHIAEAQALANQNAQIFRYNLESVAANMRSSRQCREISAKWT